MKRMMTLFLASLVLLGAIDALVLASPPGGGGSISTGGWINIVAGAAQAASAIQKTQQQQQPQIRPPHIIGTVADYQRERSMMVGFKPGKEREVRAALENLGLTVNMSSRLDFMLFTWKDGVDLNRVLNAIRRWGQMIRYSAPNYKRPREEWIDQDPKQSAEAANPLWVLEMIHAKEAWHRSQGEEIVVAVLDTGVDYRHPDLASSLYEHTGTLPSTGEKRAGVVGVNFCADGKAPNTDQTDPKACELVMSFDPSPLQKRNGQLDAHGTHVAGTIAAAGTGDGVVGVAPRCKLMPLQIFYETQGNRGKSVLIAPDSTIIFAIEYAVRHGAKVINLSISNDLTRDAFQQYLKGGPFSDVLSFAKQQGVLLVLAAGNNAQDAPKPRDVDVEPTLIASFTTHFSNMIAVAAVDSSGKLAPLSYIGKRAVSIAAPGIDIRSTLPGGGYGTRCGTSTAAPHVAGAAALVWAARPEMTPDQVIATLVKNGRTEPTLLNRVGSGKMLDLDFVATLQSLGTQRQPGNTSTAPASRGSSRRPSR